MSVCIRIYLFGLYVCVSVFMYLFIYFAFVMYFDIMYQSSPVFCVNSVIVYSTCVNPVIVSVSILTLHCELVSVLS